MKGNDQDGKRPERPRSEKDRKGIFGKGGHEMPAPPGRKNPGGGAENRPVRPRRGDYDDYPLDPRAAVRDGHDPSSTDQTKE